MVSLSLESGTQISKVVIHDLPSFFEWHHLGNFGHLVQSKGPTCQVQLGLHSLQMNRYYVYPWKLKKKRSPFPPRLLVVLPFYISYQAGQWSDKKVKKEKKLSFWMKNVVLISEFHLLICWVVSVRVAWASRIIFDGKSESMIITDNLVIDFSQALNCMDPIHAVILIIVTSITTTLYFIMIRFVIIVILPPLRSLALAQIWKLS